VELPSEMGAHGGLAYSLWLPAPAHPARVGAAQRARGGVVLLHGAGSCKENHHDFARVLLGGGLASIAFDQRGHGDSQGAMDGRAIDDIATMAALLRSRLGDPSDPALGAGDRSGGEAGDRSRGEAGDRRPPIALRGSSMGGYFALVAAAQVGAAAVVAICPAGGEGLRRGLAAGRFTFAADRPALDALLAAHDIRAAVERLDVPVLLLHAAGDEQVPVEHSRELAALLRSPRSRLITLPGGHHRSIQHDAEMQAVSLRFIERAFLAAAEV
jgi:uncharacterized protein